MKKFEFLRSSNNWKHLCEYCIEILTAPEIPTNKYIDRLNSLNSLKFTECGDLCLAFCFSLTCDCTTANKFAKYVSVID